jgi:hypothetical protein
MVLRYRPQKRKEGYHAASALFVDSGRQRSRHAGLVQLSLSRLNHRLSRGQAYPDVVQRTAQFHYEITDAVLPQPDPVFDDPTALDAAIDVLDAEPAIRQRLARWSLRRHKDLHGGRVKARKPRSYINWLPTGKGYGVASVVRFSWTWSP